MPYACPLEFVKGTQAMMDTVYRVGVDISTLTMIEPVVFHLHGSILRDKARLRSFYGKIGDGLAARGARVRIPAL